MYSTVKSVQILVVLLKQHKIKHVVMSPGGCVMPFVRSIEADPFFVGYSVVDERSAAFFALGLAQSLKEPVAVACTSGTAVCNYLSGITEAFYQDVPLVAITADRHPYMQNQLETQKLNQEYILKDVTKKSVALPVVRDDNDFWYCERLVNEALLAMHHHGSGPVHINIPSRVLGLPDGDSCTVMELPKIEAVRRICASDSEALWQQKAKELLSYKRVLVVFGQNRPYAEETVKNIEKFWRHYNCVLSTDHLSNLTCEGTLKTYAITEFDMAKVGNEFLPDLVISLGFNLPGEQIKVALRNNRGKFKHWLVDETGNVKDVFKSLSTIFECSPSHFFEVLAGYAPEQARNDEVYYNQWKNALDEIEMPDFPFTNMYVTQELAKCIPANSILHLSILNSTRQMQLFDLNENIEVFSNVGALGIDGSMSTLIGQAAVSNKLCFLLVGDLSFFYDMNSLGIRHVGSNVRILMVNNSGGGEFHLSFGKEKYPNVSEHIAAEHSATAKGWVESAGFKYYSASTSEELDVALNALVEKSDSPVFVEVFTDIELEAKTTRLCYHKNTGTGGQAKSMVKKVFGQKRIDKAKMIIKTITDE